MSGRLVTARLAVIALALAAAVAMSVDVVLTRHAGTAASAVVPLQPVGKPSLELPLPLPTDSATQVITVVSASTFARTAHLQAWSKIPDGWIRMGPAVTAHVSIGGLTLAPHEGVPATPIGSFSLTEAFGKLPDPGTGLPYFQLDDADWWISEPGPLYNTHQRCSDACPFAQAFPNTHLIDTIRAYNYAVIIGYNRDPVVQGAGSAYFLHVTTAGKPTFGCISLAQSSLIAILRWLDSQAHPRILIGIRPPSS